MITKNIWEKLRIINDSEFQFTNGVYDAGHISDIVAPYNVKSVGCIQLGCHLTPLFAVLEFDNHLRIYHRDASFNGTAYFLVDALVRYY